MLYLNRINNLRLKMKEMNVCAMYVSSPENVYYLSGFTGFGDGRLLITFLHAWIITDSRYTLQVAEQCPDYMLISGSAVNISTIESVLKEENIKVLGFEDEIISYKDFEALNSKYSNLSFKGIGNYFSDIRDIKDKCEVSFVSKACEIAYNSLNEILCLLKPGVCEIDIATELEYRMKKNGAEDRAFDTIVASGSRSALPHGAASSKKIEFGDAVTIDFGCKFNNYCSDMTRTFFVGNPSDEMKKIYNIVYDAQMAALEGYKSGITGKELDSISRNIITKAGYGPLFGHSLGHGVGLEVHEGATIGPGNNNIIRNNTIFSIEPGIYVENLGGVRIEDLVFVDDDKLINFTDKFDKKMLVL